MGGRPGPFELLRYRGRAGWLPLPEWARFMLDVGARAATTEPRNGRLVIALSLPARAFSAVLAASAAVTASFRASPPDEDAAAHFEYLASLPEGTAIAHHRANSMQHGRLLGVDLDQPDRIPRIRFQTSRGNEDRLLPEKLCTEIHVIDERGTLKVHKQKLVKEPDFVAHALPGVDVAALSAQTRLDCVLVGIQQSLEGELTAREFGASGDGRTYEGCLQRIVRARDVGGTRDAYRSAVIPASSDDDETPVTASTPRLVIFDGAHAFDSWRFRWPHSNWLVLIDRGLPSADVGAAIVNQKYATRLADSDAIEDIGVPPEIESVAWVDRT